MIIYELLALKNPFVHEKSFVSTSDHILQYESFADIESDDIVKHKLDIEDDSLKLKNSMKK